MQKLRCSSRSRAAARASTSARRMPAVCRNHDPSCRNLLQRALEKGRDVAGTPFTATFPAFLVAFSPLNVAEERDVATSPPLRQAFSGLCVATRALRAGARSRIVATPPLPVAIRTRYVALSLLGVATSSRPLLRMGSSVSARLDSATRKAVRETGKTGNATFCAFPGSGRGSRRAGPVVVSQHRSSLLQAKGA